MNVGRAFGCLVGMALAAPLAASSAGAAQPVENYKLEAGTGPQAVTVDATGDLYSANSYAGTVSRVTPEGVVTQTWAKVGPAPQAIVADSHDNVYTANGDGTISRITPAGVVDAVWASVPFGAVSGDLMSVAIDSQDNLLVGSNGSRVMSKITAGGVVVPTWARMEGDVRDIAVDSSDNVFAVLETYPGIISKLTPDGAITQTWTTAINADPWRIAVDSKDNVYTANNYNGTISKITPEGTLTKSWASLGPSARPYDIAVDATDSIYTPNETESTVSRITPAGRVTQDWALLPEVGANTLAIAVSSISAFVANQGTDTLSRIPLATPPSKPTGLAAVLDAPTGANLAWTAPEDTGGPPITGYVVRRFRDGNPTAEASLTLQGAATTFSDTGLSRGSAYTYTVAAVNGAGEGPPSALSGPVLPGTSQPPDAPIGLTINSGASFTNTKNVELTITWPPTAAFMRISNDGGFIPAQTQKYEVGEALSWALDDSVEGKNTKIVYVRFEGVGVDASRTYSDDIILDTVAPVITSVTASGQRSAQATSQSLSSKRASPKRKIVVRARAKDKISGVSRIQVSSKRPGSGAVVKSFKRTIVVKQATSVRRLFVRVEDKAGNWSKPRTVRIR